MNDLYQISGKTFVAGLEVNSNGIVVNCAPILRKWCDKRHISDIKDICKKRNLQIEQIKKSFDPKSYFFIDD